MNTFYGGSVFGGTYAAPIWHDFMIRVMQGFPVEGFEAPPPPESGTVPDVVGLDVKEAEAIVAEANFTPVSEEVDSFEPKGTVLSQSPGGGATMTLGKAVNLQVSNGKGEPVVVPRVVDLTEAEAIKILQKAGLVVDVRHVKVSDKALDGIVVSQVPIGDKEVDVGATVTINVGTFKSDGDVGGTTGPTGPTGPT
jgi:beta-lactam-binding protein with PASTA domain